MALNHCIRLTAARMRPLGFAAIAGMSLLPESLALSRCSHALMVSSSVSRTPSERLSGASRGVHDVLRDAPGEAGGPEVNLLRNADGELEHLSGNLIRLLDQDSLLVVRVENQG